MASKAPVTTAKPVGEQPMALKDVARRAAKDIAEDFSSYSRRLVEIEDGTAELRRKLATLSEQVATSEEDRRRKFEIEDYDRTQSRQSALDQQRREDAERNAAFMVRDEELRDSEEELCVMLGLPTGSHARKDIRQAYEKKLEDASKAGEGRGRGMAEREAKANKDLADAKAATETALLKQESIALNKRVTELEAKNHQLMASAEKVTDKIADVAKGAFDAAGGVTKQGHEALAAAAAGSGRSPVR